MNRKPEGSKSATLWGNLVTGELGGRSKISRVMRLRIHGTILWTIWEITVGGEYMGVKTNANKPVLIRGIFSFATDTLRI